MGNLVSLVKYSDFPFTTILIIRRLAAIAKSNSATIITAGSAPIYPLVGFSSRVAPTTTTDPNSSGSSASIDSRDALRRSALHWACLRSDAVLVKLLIGFDANINAVDAFGCMPFHYAAYRAKDNSILEYLVRHGADYQSLTMPMTDSTITTATTHAPVETTDISHNVLFQNALHVAAGAGNLIGVNFCLCAGMDANFPASNGAKPILFAAAFCRDMTVFERLAEVGADVKAVDAVGRSVVHLAGIFKNEVALDFAIRKELKIDDRDLRGKRPLDYALSRYSCETAVLPPSPSLESSHSANVKRVQDKLLLYTGMAQNVNGVPLSSLFRPAPSSTSGASTAPNVIGTVGVASTSAYVAPAPFAPSAPAAPSTDFDEELLLCAICMELSKDTAFGCGHLACHVCAYKINLCHLCKRRIETRTRIFLN